MLLSTIRVPGLTANGCVHEDVFASLPSVAHATAQALWRDQYSRHCGAHAADASRAMHCTLGVRCLLCLPPRLDAMSVPDDCFFLEAHTAL